MRLINNFRIPSIPPIISPIMAENPPLWSVMIPAYNCSQYLRYTLESVLEQAPDADIMQIEVIDDASTDADVEALVASIGKGRIGYYRQPQNVGSLRNFETCINRAKGHWVHLLHGDDLVKKGFYQEIKHLFDTYPNVGAAFTNCSLIEEKGREKYKFRLILKRSGVIDDWLYKIAEEQCVQPPSIVVKRSVYEHLGSFFAVHFGEDWEMWTRIAAHYKVAYSPKNLATYRQHNQGISSAYYASGENIVDIKKVMSIVNTYLPPKIKKEILKTSNRLFSIQIAKNAHRLFRYNTDAAFIQAKGSLQFNLNLINILLLGLLYIRYYSRSIFSFSFYGVKFRNPKKELQT